MTPGGTRCLLFAVVVVVAAEGLFELVCPVSVMEGFQSHDTARSLGLGDPVRAFAQVVAGLLWGNMNVAVHPGMLPVEFHHKQALELYCLVEQGETGTGLLLLSYVAAFLLCSVVHVCAECPHGEVQGHEELALQFVSRIVNIVQYQFAVLAGWREEQRPEVFLQMAPTAF